MLIIILIYLSKKILFINYSKFPLQFTLFEIYSTNNSVSKVPCCLLE